MTPQSEHQGTTSAPTSSPAPPADGDPRGEPRRYVPMLALANLGIYLAIMTPVLVSLAYRLQRVTDDSGQATTALGSILGLGALFALVSNPLAGRLSDRNASRFGMRRPWILGGAAIGTIALILIGAVDNVLVIGALWCVVQMSWNAALAALNATLADQVPEARRGRASGLVGLASPLAILGGNLLVNFLATDLLRFAIPAVIGLAVAIVFCATLDDRVLTQKPAGHFGVKQFFGSFIFNPFRYRDFGWVWITKFFVMFGYVGTASFLPFFLTQQMGLSESDSISTQLAANAASTVALMVSSPIAGVLSDRIGRRRPFVAAAAIIMVGGLVLLAFSPSVPMIVISMGIIGFGTGSFLAVDLALATQVLPSKNDVAKDLGVLNMANALPQSVAPAVAPLVIAAGSLTALGGYTVWYLTIAVIVLLGGVLVFRVRGVR